jgi:CheY-like chemotaxis protein/DNA-directed RNA polymerase subunit RPC12/RpoP
MTAKKEPVEIKCAGCGANFRLWIPAESLKEWEKGGRISCIRCGEQFLVKRNESGFSVRAVNERTPQEAPGEAAQTVLLVEDDKLAREMVGYALKDIGIRLVSAKNSTEALRSVKTGEPSLIVTDMYLKNPSDPEALLDGEDLLKSISDLGLTIPAILTTGKDIIDDLVLDPKWFDLQVKGFIQKGNPFWAEELKVKIKEILNKA